MAWRTSSTRDGTCPPLQWKQEVLTIRPLGKSCPEIVDSTTNSTWDSNLASILKYLPW